MSYHKWKYSPVGGFKEARTIETDDGRTILSDPIRCKDGDDWVSGDATDDDFALAVHSVNAMLSLAEFLQCDPGKLAKGLAEGEMMRMFKYAVSHDLGTAAEIGSHYR